MKIQMEPNHGLSAVFSLIGILLILIFAPETTFASETTIYSFCNPSQINCPGGTFPISGLTIGSDGLIYGTTPYSGIYGYGTIFNVSASETLNTLWSFGPNAANCPGSNYCVYQEAPYSKLVLAPDGYLYGTTQGSINLAGADGGVIFRFSPTTGPQAIYSFCASGGGCSDGVEPNGLVLGKDGYLYGTTLAGGDESEDAGTIFKISTSGQLTTLHVFSGRDGDGFNPEPTLIQAADGNLYGVTNYGGSSNYGTIFKITPEGAFTTLYNFSGQADGGAPRSGLAQASDGLLYGTSLYDNANYPVNGGTFYSISTNGAFSIVYTLPIAQGGVEASLIQGIDGNFYGTTFGGGANGTGSIFQLTSQGAFNTIFSFGAISYENNTFINDDGTPNGESALLQAADGSFYGVAEQGGTYGGGTVYRIYGPFPPPALAASGKKGKVKLSWQASAGATSYTVYEGTAAGAESATPIETDLTKTKLTVKNLTSGTTYYFKVAAANADGTSQPSAEVSATAE